MKDHIFLLPAEAYADTTAPVIAVKRGETGFYPIHTRATPEDLNGGALSDAIMHSAVIASMVGWDVPGARAAIEYLDLRDAAPVLVAQDAPDLREDTTGDMFALEKAYAVIEQRDRAGTKPGGPSLFDLAATTFVVMIAAGHHPAYLTQASDEDDEGDQPPRTADASLALSFGTEQDASAAMAEAIAAYPAFSFKVAPLA